MFKIGDVIHTKNNPNFKYRIIESWKNVFGDDMFTIQRVDLPDFKMRDFQKYVTQDYVLAE